MHQVTAGIHQIDVMTSVFFRWIQTMNPMRRRSGFCLVSISNKREMEEKSIRNSSATLFPRARYVIVIVLLLVIVSYYASTVMFRLPI